MRVKTVVGDGSAAHQQLLDEIFAGLGSTEIELVRLEERAALFEAGHQPTPDQISAGSGLSLRLLKPAGGNPRVKWEMRLVAGALKERARRDRLTQIVWVDFGSGGHSLEGTHVVSGPLSESDVERMRVEIEGAAAASGATLERLDVLRPLGHTWAAQLLVQEPHSYLRRRLRGFLAAVEAWEERCGGQRYLEVRDAQQAPVLVHTQAGNAGSSSLRVDLKCCDPFVRVSRGMFELPPGTCPVFD